MADSLAHRGPDGEGFYINTSETLGFAHRRLAIIDLSSAGIQPMHYAERYTIVYNGELYNFPELKRELKKAGYLFDSQSDTEVILAAYASYGEKCLQYFDGMFAFAIWDEKEKKLFAARDRFGEKPFYYQKTSTQFIFASEMKALWAAGIERSVDQKMLLNYISLGHVHNAGNKAQTFYEKIYALPRAHYLVFDAAKNDLAIQPYWDIDKQNQVRISESRASEKLDHLLQISVSRRLRSDVPVGTSLSGGLDSSSILSYVIQQLRPGQDLKTFSAVFPGFEKDESSFIKQVCDNWKIPNQTVTPGADDLVKDFSRLCYHQEEPFPSSSIFAQYKVYERAAADNIHVLLDGQGADEILAGYNKYIHWYLQEVVNRNRFKKFSREKLKFSANKIPYRWGLRNIIAAWLPSHVSIALEKKEYNRIAFNHDISKEFLQTAKGREWEGIHKPVVTKLNDILYFNTMQNGLEELLRYCDRNSMAHGVEVRLPFLYDELVRFIFSLPSDLKMNDGFTKYILRKTVETKLPSSIAWRTDKVGFEPPQKSWLEDTRMQELINDHKSFLVKENILKPQVLNRKARHYNVHEGDNYEWRYLSAAEFLQQGR